jgi:putative ABC transport system substrate-binding protein
VLQERISQSSGGAAAAWPLAARAQQRTMQVIGLLNGQLTGGNLLAAFRQGLVDAGFVEGRNLAIVYRSAEGNTERSAALAAELVRIPVAVLAAVGGDLTVLAAKAATPTIPVVFTTGGDPVEIGIVASLNRPGGNVTGVTFLGSTIASKQIGLLRDMVPRLTTIGVLLNPANPMTPSIVRDVQAAAQSVGLKAVVVEASTERDIDTAFAQFVVQRVDALVLGSAAFFNRYPDNPSSVHPETSEPIPDALDRGDADAGRGFGRGGFGPVQSLVRRLGGGQCGCPRVLMA